MRLLCLIADSDAQKQQCLLLQSVEHYHPSCSAATRLQSSRKLNAHDSHHALVANARTELLPLLPDAPALGTGVFVGVSDSPAAIYGVTQCLQKPLTAPGLCRK